MTPKSHTYTPSAEDPSEPPASEGESGDESLPPHTSEIGTLKKLPNSGTAWLGSSSGVYFVNTVRRAFSAALADTSTNSAIPASEDILTGEGEDGKNYNGPVTDGPSLTDGDFRRGILAALGRPPKDRDLAMELVTTFFRCWHPLFPFMHGPRFLQDVDLIYAMKNHDDPGKYSAQESRKVITFQLIINIASLDRADLHLPADSRIKSTADVTRVAGCFSVNHDIAAIQLLIAAELYLVATISLRQASTVAGMILKLIYHAGLHRCPLRYAQLSLEDCEIRKRIFWSAYALDRHLSLSLGDPNTVQDNDIDVCLSGRELHKAVAHDLILNPSDELKMHLPRPQTGPHGSGSPTDDPRVVNLNDGPQAREKQQREAAMTAYVHYGKLTGQIIEIFHKSIHARFQKPDAITFLNSDIETWWNDLPGAFTDTDDDDYSAQPQPPPQPRTQAKRSGSSAASPHDSSTNNLASEHDKAGSTASPANNTNDGTTANSAPPPTPPTHKQLAPFFMILYQQLLLLLNRPRLSLDQSTAEFQHGLQVCIKASRNTLTALRKHREYGQSMLLPGLLSAAWMAGLIIAFACQLGKYPKLRACGDISNCLTWLESMGGCSQWFTVKNCRQVLGLLLENIKGRRAGSSGFLTAISQNAIQSQVHASQFGHSLHSALHHGESSIGSHSGGGNQSLGPGNTTSRKRVHEDRGDRDQPMTDLQQASPKRKSVSVGAPSPASSTEVGMQPPPPPNSSTSNPRTPTGSTFTPLPAATTGSNSTSLRHQIQGHSSSSGRNDGNPNPGASVNQTTLGDRLNTAGKKRSSPLSSRHRKTRSNASATASLSRAGSQSDSNSPYMGDATFPAVSQSVQSTNTNDAIAGNTSNMFTSGSALYNDPQDIAFAQSSHNLHPTDFPSSSFADPTGSANMMNAAGGGDVNMMNLNPNMDDPMFWGNFDYNVADIFGMASWENMTGGGGAGPMGDVTGPATGGMGMGMGMGIGMPNVWSGLFNNVGGSAGAGDGSGNANTGSSL